MVNIHCTLCLLFTINTMINIYHAVGKVPMDSTPYATAKLAGEVGTLIVQEDQQGRYMCASVLSQYFVLSVSIKPVH